jgi:hypothetical protein
MGDNLPSNDSTVSPMSLNAALSVEAKAEDKLVSKEGVSYETLNYQSLIRPLIDEVLPVLALRPKWHTPSKNHCTRRFDIVHVLDMLVKDSWTHADCLIEVSDSSARFAFGVSIKQVCMPRLKVELDPGHP